MNEKNTLPASAMVPDVSSQEFSRANLFGMFVTLQLCQLTQPYGSLLFRGSSGFFWRVNPIASFVEALIIAHYLLKTIWQAWRDGHGLNRTQWGKELRATASALLLLRGALEDEDGGLMVKLMAATALDGSQHVETQLASEGTTPSEANAGQEVADVPPDPSRMPGIHESYEMGPITTQSDRQDSQTATPQQGVIRRRTSQLESAPVRRTNTIMGPDPSSERSQLLRAAFGPNALAHREMRIDIVTAVSVLVILIKLLAIRSLWVFLTAAYFIVCGWVLVQSLLLIFHFREMSDLDMGKSVRAARSLDAALKASSPFWMFLYVALHVPSLGYLCYVLAFQLDLPPWLQWVRVVVDMVLVMMITFVVTISFVGVIICVPLSLYLLYTGGLSLVMSLCKRVVPVWRRTPSEILSGNFESHLKIFGAGILTSLGSLLLLWLAFGGYTYYSKVGMALSPEDFGSYTPVFGNSTISILLDSGFTNSMAGIWMIFLFFICLSIFCGVLLPDGGESRNRVSWGNFLVTIIVFVYYLITYDPRGTNKPAWTEWLG